MMRYIISWFLILFATTTFAQNWNDVKSSQDYVFGEGTGATVDEADQRALSDLTSRISVFVQSSFEVESSEKMVNDQLDSRSLVAGRMKTYSQATITNANRIVLSPAPEARVGRWMLKTEVDRLFQLRLKKARGMVETAQRAESEGRVDEALRQYYWAYLLTQSLRYPSKADYIDSDGEQHLLTVWIPERMRAIMDDVNCVMTGREDDDIEVAFTFKGKPVASLDFTYFDGRDWTPVTSASGGQGFMEMAEGFGGETLQVRIEYEYRSEAHIDRELQGVMEVVSTLPFPKASKTFRSSAVALPAVATDDAAATAGASSGALPRVEAGMGVQAPEVLTDVQAYDAVMKRAIAAIRSRNINSLQGCMTAEGLDIYERLLHRGKVHIVGTPQLVFHRSADGVVCRGVQMAFSPQNSLRKSFVEDVVFTFDDEARIKNVSFGLGQVAERDILCKGIWEEHVRVAIMQFLENYKTAYALKRLDYIRTLFDDNAVIITGSLVRNTGQRAMQLDTDSRRFTKRDVRYTRQTKEQYMRNLARCFQSNEFVNIRFSSNDVVKLGKGGELYSIQIEQDYYSSTYGDHGYLFLMVDLNDAAHPLIKVRTWQPEKDPNFGLYGPGDFK